MDDSTTATGSGLSPYDAPVPTGQHASDIARALPSRAASILDAGCATGGLLTALREQGFTPSPDSIRRRAARPRVAIGL